jgi:hypothetical protein
MAWCPECGTSYGPEIVACPRCRVSLVDERPPRPDDVVVVHRVPDAAAGALLCGLLENNGVTAVLRSTRLPGYGDVRRDWSTSAWGEILVAGRSLEEARGIIADYLEALEHGGAVRDEDVEGESEGV